MKINKPSENSKESKQSLTKSNLLRIKKPSTDSTGKSKKRVVSLNKSTKVNTPIDDEIIKDAAIASSEDVRNNQEDKNAESQEKTLELLKINKPFENSKELKSKLIVTKSNRLRIKKPPTDSTGKSKKRVVSLIQATKENTPLNDEIIKDAAIASSEDVRNNQEEKNAENEENSEKTLELLKINKPFENSKESKPILTKLNRLRIKKPPTDSTGKSKKRVVSLIQATKENTHLDDEIIKDAAIASSDEVLVGNKLSDNEEEALADVESAVTETTKTVIHRLKLPKRKSKVTSHHAKAYTGEILFI